MNKSDLRSFYKEKRSQLENQERISASKMIAEKLFSSFGFENELISVFLPISRLNEIDTSFILEKFSLSNTFCSPVADFSNHTMKHLELNSQTVIKENSWGIPEPSKSHSFSPREITVVIVPLLISDIHGNRLGYGKGFYDRFLSEIQDEVTIIGINFFEPIQMIPDVGPLDVPIHYLVTPNKVFRSE